MPRRTSSDPRALGDPGDPVATDHQTSALTTEDYVRLANFRYQLRIFSRETELAARRVGLTPQQYFLLLAIRGFPNQETPSISDLAERLQIRHNAAIGLVNRAVERELVAREDPTDEDKRIVRVRLTPTGIRCLDALAVSLRAERVRLFQAVEALGPDE